MTYKPQFNIVDAQLTNELFVTFVLEDGTKVTLTCENITHAAKVSEAIVHGIQIERKK